MLVKECREHAGDRTLCTVTVAVDMGTYASDNIVEDEIHTWTGQVKLEKSVCRRQMSHQCQYSAGDIVL